MKFKTPYNFNPETDILAEENNLPSMTEPDMSMSVRDIIYRMAQGGSVNGFEPDYDGLQPDFDDLDITQTFQDMTDYDEAQRELAYRQSLRKVSSMDVSDKKKSDAPKPTTPSEPGYDLGDDKDSVASDDE